MVDIQSRLSFRSFQEPTDPKCSDSMHRPFDINIYRRIFALPDCFPGSALLSVCKIACPVFIRQIILMLWGMDCLPVVAFSMFNRFVLTRISDTACRCLLFINKIIRFLMRIQDASCSCCVQDYSLYWERYLIREAEFACHWILYWERVQESSCSSQLQIKYMRLVSASHRSTPTLFVIIACQTPLNLKYIADWICTARFLFKPLFQYCWMSIRDSKTNSNFILLCHFVHWHRHFYFGFSFFHCSFSRSMLWHPIWFLDARWCINIFIESRRKGNFSKERAWAGNPARATEYL